MITTPDFFRFKPLLTGLSLAMLLLSAGSCSKDDDAPTLTYKVTYSVASSGSVNLNTITVVDEFGFERPVAPPSDFTITLRIQPGVKAGIRVTGNVANGTVTVGLKAVNSEHDYDQETPFSASGSVPQSFDIRLEQELE